MPSSSRRCRATISTISTVSNWSVSSPSGLARFVQPISSTDQTEPEGRDHGLHAPSDTELLAQMLHMALHGAPADAEDDTDFPVRLALDQPEQAFALAHCEPHGGNARPSCAMTMPRLAAVAA